MTDVLAFGRPSEQDTPRPVVLPARGEVRFRQLQDATADFQPPFGVVDLDAFDVNAFELLRRAGGKPIRLASKSVRARALLSHALGRGMNGILGFTLPEALWLAEWFERYGWGVSFWASQEMSSGSVTP